MITQATSPAPFALGFGQQRQPEPAAAFAYDAQQQVSTFPNGSLAVFDRALMAGTGATSSTAGSKTHNDDD